MSRGYLVEAGQPMTAFITISRRGRAEADRLNLALINLTQQHDQVGEN
jgi:hypothetical protein